MQVCVPVGEKVWEPLVPVTVPLPMLPLPQLNEVFPVALVELHDNDEVCPFVMEAGVKLAVHVGALPTLTVAVQVLVPPAPLSTLRVHV